MKPALLCTLAALSLLAATPAIAAPAAAEPAAAEPGAAHPAPARPQDLPAPWLGAVCSLAGPIAFAAVCGGIATVGSSIGADSGVGNALLLVGNIGLFAAPAGSCAGQLYAGDPQRALWVGLGGAGVAAVSIVGGTLAGGTSGGGVAGLFADIGFGTIYSAWAAWDAYHIIDAENDVKLHPSRWPAMQNLH